MTSTIPALSTVAHEASAALSTVTPARWSALLRLLRHSGRNVLVSGQGRSGLVAQMVAMRLMHLGLAAHAVGEPTAPPIRSGDLLVIVSGSGETPVSVDFARIAHAVGAQVTLVTGAPSSTLADAADVVIELAAGSSTQFAGSRFEQAALLCLDAVVLELMHDEGESVTAAMAERHTNLQ